MENDSEKSVALEDTPVAKAKFPLVIVLSVFLAILLVIIAVGGVLFYQRSKALQAEVIAVKKEMSEKTHIYDALQKQIQALSRQMDVLKEYSIARSGAAKLNEAQPEAAVDGAQPNVKPVPESALAVPSAPAAPVVPVAPAKAIVTLAKPGQAAAVAPDVVPPVAPKGGRQKSEGQNCDLVGKSAEDQAATLKRCVGVMDSPKEKSLAK